MLLADNKGNAGTGGVGDGVSMKSIGVRELTYRLMFAGSDVQVRKASV